VVLSGSWWSSGEYPSITPALVLAAVIEAVESHGLDWRVEGDGADYLAEIDNRSADIWRHSARGDSPAAALLSAHLSALDYQASVDEYGGTR